MGIEVHQQVMACAGLVPTQIQEDMVSEITMIDLNVLDWITATMSEAVLGHVVG